MKRHARKARQVYRERRDRFAELMEEALVDGLEFDVPNGGLAIWARMKGPGSAEAWAEPAEKMGLIVTPGIHFTLDASRELECSRLGFASLDEKELQRAMQLLVRSW